ncbi:MAG: protein kinase [Acidobacteriota bacterium]
MKNKNGQLIAERYRILKKLDSGGMGDIFLAEDESSLRKVVIKNPHSFKKDEESKKRFHQEAEILKEIKHPNIVNLYDFVEWKGELYIILEYLEGKTLKDKITEKITFSLEEIDAIFLQILEALEAAHKKSIVHRDVKPSNIFCLKREGVDDLIKVLDFGTALNLEQEFDSRLTKTGHIVGTPVYLSPEQILGKKDITLHSDIYSLGIILYELFSGSPPFLGDNSFELYSAHLYKIPAQIDRPDLENDPLYEKYLEIVFKCLKKNIDDRFDSISEIKNFLKEKIVKSIGNDIRVDKDRSIRYKDFIQGPVDLKGKQNQQELLRNENLKLMKTTYYSKSKNSRKVNMKGKEVLVCEDENKSLEMSIIPLLKISKHSVIKLPDCSSDINKILGSPDLIIINKDIDQNLTILTEIKNSRLSEKPVLVCGKEDDLDFIFSAIEAGASDYISFPLSPESVLKKIINFTSK